jgi:hypothetical protein
MSNMAKKIASATSSNDPKRAFETALAHIQHQHPREPLTPARTPIAIRKGAATQSDQATEKRALTDAAHALAQLWNVVRTPVR